MSRRFFSGRSLQAAVLTAAAKFDLEPDELAYEEIDKRHGLLKSRGKVVIAVDPDQPRKGAGADRKVPGEVAPAKPRSPSRRPARAPKEAESAAEDEVEATEGGEDEAPVEVPVKASPRPRRRRTAAPRAEVEAPADDEPEEAAPPQEAEDAEREPVRSRGRGRDRSEGRSEERREEAVRGIREAGPEMDVSGEPSREERDERPRRSREAAAPDRPAREDSSPRGREPRGSERSEGAARSGRDGRGEGGADRAPRGGDRAERPERRERGAVAERSGEDRSPRERQDRGSRTGERPARGERPERRDREDRAPRGAEPAGREGLVELPDRPRALADRYPRARGPLAKAAQEAIAAIAAVAGLKVQAEVFEGDDRLEIDLSGPHHGLLVAEDGELLVAIEHLLPRAMRGYGGETAAVRVDCENFQEIREERLRSYAQVVAGEVRRSGRPRNLDPLSPSDRRIVHLTVADEPGVESESEGNGYLKRVRVSPA